VKTAKQVLYELIDRWAYFPASVQQAPGTAIGHLSEADRDALATLTSGDIERLRAPAVQPWQLDSHMIRPISATEWARINRDKSAK